jgi:hypothetical protein
MLELKEHTGTVCGFAEGDDPRATNDWLQRLKIRRIQSWPQRLSGDNDKFW